MAIAVRGLAFILACGAALAGARGAAAASDPFYDGKQLDFVSSSAPGGGYDAYARLIARHLPRQLPVKAVVVQNMPGAGGIRATQHLFNTAAKTGLVIGMVTNNVPFTPLYEEKSWGFDATKFNWLGSPNRETPIMFVWNTIPVFTIAQARERELILGTTGPTSTAAFYGRLLAAVLGLKIKAVHGYKGQPEALIAMERGEIEGRAAITYASVKIGQPDWVKNKKLNFILQVGLQKEKELPDVPLLIDLAQNQDQKDIFGFLSRVSALGRVLLAGPGVPAERVAALQKAFTATMNDPDLQSEAAKSNAELSPMDGETVRKLYLEKLNTDPAVLAKIRTAMEPRKEDQVEYQEKK